MPDGKLPQLRDQAHRVAPDTRDAQRTRRPPTLAAVRKEVIVGCATRLHKKKRRTSAELGLNSMLIQHGDEIIDG